MKRQLVIIGIVAILICVGLSGCNEDTNNGENEAPEGNFIMFPLWEDNFHTVSQEGSTGTVWVNVTITNMGNAGWGTIYVEVYQGTGNYTTCGKVYSKHYSDNIFLNANQTTTKTFTFVGVENHNHTGCYGVLYGVE